MLRDGILALQALLLAAAAASAAGSGGSGVVEPALLLLAATKLLVVAAETQRHQFEEHLRKALIERLSASASFRTQVSLDHTQFAINTVDSWIRTMGSNNLLPPSAVDLLILVLHHPFVSWTQPQRAALMAHPLCAPHEFEAFHAMNGLLHHRMVPFASKLLKLMIAATDFGCTDLFVFPSNPSSTCKLVAATNAATADMAAVAMMGTDVVIGVELCEATTITPSSAVVVISPTCTLNPGSIARRLVCLSGPAAASCSAGGVARALLEWKLTAGMISQEILGHVAPAASGSTAVALAPKRARTE